MVGKNVLSHQSTRPTQPPAIKEEEKVESKDIKNMNKIKAYNIYYIHNKYDIHLRTSENGTVKRTLVAIIDWKNS